MCLDTDCALFQQDSCVHASLCVEEDGATLPGPSCLVCEGGWFSLTWLSEVGGHRDCRVAHCPPQGSWAWITVLISIPQEQKEARSSERPCPTQSVLPSPGRICQDYTQVKGENKDVTCNACLSLLIFLKLLDGASLGSDRGKLRPWEEYWADSHMFAHFSTPSVTCYPNHCFIHLLISETSIESLLDARQCSRCRGTAANQADN